MKGERVKDRKRETEMDRANGVYHTIDPRILFSLMNFKSLTLPTVGKKGIFLLRVYTHSVHIAFMAP